MFSDVVRGMSVAQSVRGWSPRFITCLSYVVRGMSVTKVLGVRHIDVYHLFSDVVRCMGVTQSVRG